MSKGKILFIDTVHPYLQEALEDHGFTCVDGYHLSKAEITTSWNGYIGLVIRSRFKIDREFLSFAYGLKFIARAGAGMENIDTEAATSMGVACLNAPEGNRNAVAEQAMAMLLALNNHLLRADREVREGVWLREENRGWELEGKTVGIIGFGNTGRSFANKLVGFDVTILVFDPYVQILAADYPHVRQSTLSELQEQCDVVSLHVPLTEETRYMVNDEFLNGFKKPIRLINTSRGKVVDTAALVRGMESGRIIGAALDVIEYESVSFETLDNKQLPEPMRYLINSDRTVLTPHIAGWTYESHFKISKVLFEKIIQLFR